MKHEELLAEAPFGIVGIDEDLGVFGGYDQPMHEAWLDDGSFCDDSLSPKERVLLALHMIDRWTQYLKASLP